MFYRFTQLSQSSLHRQIIYEPDRRNMTCFTSPVARIAIRFSDEEFDEQQLRYDQTCRTFYRLSLML